MLGLDECSQAAERIGLYLMDRTEVAGCADGDKR